MPKLLQKNLEKIYKQVAKITKEVYEAQRPNPLLAEGISSTESLVIRLNESFQVQGVTTLQALPWQDHVMERLRNTCLLTSLRDVEQASDSFRALFWVYQFTRQLLLNGAIIPQLLHTKQNIYIIRWIPATNHAPVKHLFDTLLRIVPSDLLQIETQKTIAYQTPEQQLYTLCALCIHDILNLAAIEAVGIKPTYSRSHTKGYSITYEWIDEFFFRQEPYAFNRFEDKEIPAIIQRWLNNFYITHKNFVPTLRVTEQEETAEFEVDVLIEDKSKPMNAPASLQEVLKKKAYEASRFDILQDLMLLANYFPALSKVVNSKGTKKATFDTQSFVEVLLSILPVMQLFGIQILLPKSLKSWVRPAISGTLTGKKKFQVGSYLNLEDMLTFNWQISLGDEVIDPKEFRQLVRNTNGLVKIKDRYILVEQKELDKLYKRLENPPSLSGVDLLKTALAEEYNGHKIGLSAEVLELLKTLTQPQTIPLPEGLQATLRPYQRSGYDWMLKNTQLGFGSLLADDMGLGKTLQVITLLLKFKEDGAFQKKKGIIVVPTTLLTNWQKEISRFAPSLRAATYHGTNRKLDLTQHDLLLTTYGLIRSDADKLKKTDWYCMVIDEAQNIKNPTVEQTKAVKTLKADIRIAMSGTPVENRLSEFWSILDFTNKGYLGNLNKFTTDFARPIQLEGDQKQLDIFKKITAPFLLRRVKTDRSIISDLPDKVENNHYSSLVKEQAALYESVVSQTMKDIEESEGIARKGLVLKLMTALKQIGNHPFQYTGKGNAKAELSGKALLLLEILENIYEANEKVLIFTQYKEMGDLLVQFIDTHFQRQSLFLHGGVSRKKRDEMVAQFQTDRHAHTFVLSLKAGGTGLNLTQANHVIHYDLWWNPAVEAQATDRAFRIGQTKNVLVYRLINQGTFEEKINDMIHSKKNLATMSVQTGETWLGDMSTEDLKKLIALT